MSALCCKDLYIFQKLKDLLSVLNSYTDTLQRSNHSEKTTLAKVCGITQKTRPVNYSRPSHHNWHKQGKTPRQGYRQAKTRNDYANVTYRPQND